ncbi:MAG: hypothetical protein WC568_02325 [Candidatus Methanoperedens sp.]
MPENNKTEEFLRKLAPCIERGELEGCEVLRKYEQGKISISRAAEDAGLTIEEIEEYMVRKGYRSKYSTVDLGREMELLKS